MGMSGYNSMEGGMVTMMVVGGLFWILVLVGIGFLLYALISRWQQNGQRPQTTRSQADDPLALLRIRYARGEITSEEYERMRVELSDDVPPKA